VSYWCFHLHCSSTFFFSVFRAAVEPLDGWFNETYLSYMSDIVTKAGSYGIYTVIEFHQDAWNAMYCGNGAPDWVSKVSDKSNNFPMPIGPPVEVDPTTGHPTKETCDSINDNTWTKYYFTFATSEAVGNLYNSADLRNRFALYWGKIASHFVSSPFIIGYEMMNEPWAGNIYEEPKLLIPGSADHSKLQQLYDDASNVIRQTDKDHLILFQGVTWEVVVPIGEKHGFDHAPGGLAFANKSSLAWHCDVLSSVTPEDTYFSWKFDEMRRLSVGGFVTEVVGDSGRCDILDKYKISWMQFSYKIFADLTWDNSGLFYRPCSDPSSMDACLNVAEVKTWARTYAKAVAGHTNYFRYNSTTRVAELNYISKPGCKLPTVLFVSEKWIYTSGFTVQVTPDTVAWEHQEPDHIVITHHSLQPTNITVTVTPV
jgi:endoglycosylceramidase